MTFHFAYPNVLPRSNIYIGCGRYAVFPPEKEPDKAYREVLEAPMTPNRNLLARAIQLLAAERYHSRNRLFHIQDQTEHIYQGDSLDLAWLLAQIHCSRDLCRTVNGDIWCTGILDLDKDGVHLLGVNHDGFCLKLEAFLDRANTDMLFIVPLANINSRIVTLCEEAGVAIQQLDTCSRRLFTAKRKQVLAVPANGMTKLLELLFIKSNIARTATGGILLLVAISLGCWFARPYLLPFLPEKKAEKRVTEKSAAVKETDTDTLQQKASLPQQATEQQQKKTTQQIVAAIKQGDFEPLATFLLTDGHDKSPAPEDLLLRQQITCPVAVETRLRYQFADGRKGDTTFAKGAAPPPLTSMDYYRLILTINSPAEELWLYVLQVDSLGKSSMLFPSAALGSINPIPVAKRTVQIPENSEQWLVLDELPENEEKQIKENIYLLLSPWPAEDLEKLLSSVAKDSGSTARSAILRQLKKREDIKIPALYYHHWSFSHNRPVQPSRPPVAEEKK